MGRTRTEQAVDEMSLDDADDFEPSCDDIRLAWLAGELGPDGRQDFEALWSDR